MDGCVPSTKNTHTHRQTHTTHRAGVDERLPVHAHIPPLPAGTLETFGVCHVQMNPVQTSQPVCSSRQDATGQAARNKTNKNTAGSNKGTRRRRHLVSVGIRAIMQHTANDLCHRAANDDTRATECIAKRYRKPPRETGITLTAIQNDAEAKPSRK